METEPTTYRVGDRVMIVNLESEYFGMIGIVSTIGGWQPNSLYVDIELSSFSLTNHGEGPFTATDLRRFPYAPR